MPSPPLDARMAEIRSQPGRTWGVLDALLAMAAVPLAAAALAAAVQVGLRLPDAATLAVASAVMCGLAVLAGRRAAQQSGGWSRALGVELPEWRDVGRIVGWTVLLLVTQSLLYALLTTLPALRDVEPETNTGFLEDVPLGVLLLFAVLAVTVAPVVEEVLFRGVALRGLMTRLPFWPAAVITTVFFALLHVQRASAGAVYVVVVITVLGLVLCVLTRRTGRLGPAIGVHALYNAAGVLITVVTTG
ncbi:MAG: CPBP family intramembrane glutamic endopeptidase [Actinomycetes bacterium]